jgi:hypothetical protein
MVLRGRDIIVLALESSMEEGEENIDNHCMSAICKADVPVNERHSISL